MDMPFSVLMLIIISITCLSFTACKITDRAESSKYKWKVSVIKNPTSVKFDQLENQIIDGTGFKTFKILQERIPFRYELVKPFDKFYGNKNSNGSWNGLVGRFARKEADIAFIPLFQSYDRFEVCDFSTPVTFSHITFAVRAPSSQINWASIFKPFTMEMWTGISICAFIFGLSLFVILKNDSYIDANANLKPWPITKVYWFVFGCFTNKGGNLVNVKRTPSRLSIGIWWLSVVVIVSAYSSVLMSFMTVPLYQKIPKTFGELENAVLNGEYSCGVLENNIIHSFLLTSKGGQTKLFADEITRSKNLFQNNEDGWQKVLNENFAYFTFTGSYQNLKKYGVHNFFVSRSRLTSLVASYAMRKNFPYKRKINKILSYLFEAGILNKNQEDLGPKYDFSRKKISAEAYPLSMEDLLSPFILLGCGYISSTICLAIELILSKNKCK